MKSGFRMEETSLQWESHQTSSRCLILTLPKAQLTCNAKVIVLESDKLSGLKMTRGSPRLARTASSTFTTLNT